MEGVALIWSKRHKRRTHCPAVQIARHVEVRIRELLGFEVVGCCRTHLPSRTEVQTAVQTQVVSELDFILIFVVVIVG